ncbi:MAG: VOC family protein, partial [Ferrovibrionaceae bacterium]
MSRALTGLDHPLVGVADLEAARAGWARLGFTPTPRGRHIGWGTANYCIMFPDSYLELLGVVDPGQFTAGLAERLAWIEARLAGAPLPPPAVRPWRPGDMGLITAQQAVYYRGAYGWGDAMEVLIGEITSRFVRDFDPGREQCWV